MRCFRGRRINFIEPPVFMTLHAARLSSINAHVVLRCSSISRRGNAGSNSVLSARSAAPISASSVLWDTQVCRREAMLWLALV
eukprot:1427830-Pyramimonas_sp.AAC.1